MVKNEQIQELTYLIIQCVIKGATFGPSFELNGAEVRAPRTQHERILISFMHQKE